MTTPVDWRHEARTLLAAGYGQRETARKLGVPEDRLRKWAQRAGIKASPVVVPSVPCNLKRVPAVPTAALVLQDELSTRGANGRLNAARIGDGTLAVIASEPTERQIALLEAANQAGSLMQKGNVPGWERQPQNTEQHSHLHLHQHLRPDQ